MNAMFAGSEEARSQIVIDGVVFSASEFDEIVDFKIAGVLGRIGFARACYMTTNIDVYKCSIDGEEAYCGEIEMPDDDDDVDSDRINRQCIELILDSKAV